MNRFKYLIGALFFLILGYSGLWWTSAMGAAKALEATFERWEADGHSVDASDVMVTGFPYRIELRISELKLEQKGKVAGVAATDVLLISHLWTPRHWVGEAKDARVSFARGRLAFTDGSLRASWRKEDDGSEIVALDSAGDLSDFSLEAAPYMTTPSALKSWLLSARLHAPQADAATGLHEEKGTDFRITAEGEAGSLLLLGVASGKTPEGWTKEGLGGWSSSGGLIDFKEIDLGLPGGRVKGSGSVTLDEKTMPLGSFSLTVAGGKDVAATLIEAGMLMKGAGNAFGEQAARTPVSVMLQSGAISAGGVMVGRMEPLAK